MEYILKFIGLLYTAILTCAFPLQYIAGAMVIAGLGQWGNYSVPGDNPFDEDKELQPEIWALGFRNPWRCSFDSERPSYFLCADVGEVGLSLALFLFLYRLHAYMFLFKASFFFFFGDIHYPYLI